jgi:hypothetical protein
VDAGVDAGTPEDAGPVGVVDAGAPFDGGDAGGETCPEVDAGPFDAGALLVFDGGPGFDAGTLALAYAHYFNAFCQTLVRCQQISDEQFCVSFYAQALGTTDFNSPGALEAAVAAGKAAFNVDEAVACIAGAATAACANAEVGLSSTACRGMVTGTVAPGGACLHNQECANANAVCQPTGATGGCSGVCVIDCGSAADCPTGLACDPSTRECVAIPCSTTSDCGADAGLTCDTDGGFCVDPPLPGAGEPCAALGNCAAGAVCNNFDNICTELAGSGQMCFGSNSCVSGLQCAILPSGSAECEGPAAPGESCDPTVASACAGGLQCLTSPSGVTCQPSGFEGQACSGAPGSCACDLLCENITNGAGTCLPPALLGESCDITVAGSCAAGLTCIPDSADSGSTCWPLASLGDSCVSLYQCGTALSSMACDPATQKCVLAPETGPCVGGVVCDLLTSYCDTTQTTPTCIPYLSVGATCNPNDVLTSAGLPFQSWTECGLPLSPNICVASSTGGASGTCVSTLGPTCTP